MHRHSRIVSHLTSLRSFVAPNLCKQPTQQIIVGLTKFQQRRFTSSYTPGELLRRYRDKVDQKLLRPDTSQHACVTQLSALADELVEYDESLAAYRKDLEAYQISSRTLSLKQEKREAMRQKLKQKEQAAAEREQARRASGSSAWVRAHQWWRRNFLAEPPPPRLSPEQQAILAATKREQRLDGLLGPPRQPPTAPKGLYIYGSVGSGKSLLASMFYDLVDQKGVVPLRRKLHFNSAMLEINSRIWGYEKERISRDLRLVERTVEHQHSRGDRGGGPDGGGGQREPMPQRAAHATQAAELRPKLAARRGRMQMLRRTPKEHSEALARSNSVILTRTAQALIRGGTDDAAGLQGRQPAVLYFDEMQITDPFTAASLKAVMEEILHEGAVLLITSNRPPSQLTNHGLHEDLFSHFLEQLQRACNIVELGSGTDYRRLGCQEVRAGNFTHPLTADTAAALEARWEARVAALSSPPAGESVPVMFGRTVELTAGQVAGGAARFSFQQLCKTLMSAADYQALAQRFDTLFITDVPAMSFATRDQARRTILLVDELYNHKCQLVCTAEVAPDLLFAGAESEEPLVDLEALQFETAAEGGRLRRDVMADGGLAPVASQAGQALALQARLGGLEEQFAFKRAVSRLHEMQTSAYLQLRPHG